MCSPLLGGGSGDNLDLYARNFVTYMRGAADGYCVVGRVNPFAGVSAFHNWP